MAIGAKLLAAYIGNGMTCALIETPGFDCVDAAFISRFGGRFRCDAAVLA